MSAAVAARERMQVFGTGAVTRHIKQAAAFECSESIHKVNVELVEKPVNGPVHTPLLKPPSHFPKKLVFSASGPDSRPACAGHAD